MKKLVKGESLNANTRLGELPQPQRTIKNQDVLGGLNPQNSILVSELIKGKKTPFSKQKSATSTHRTRDKKIDEVYTGSFPNLEESSQDYEFKYGEQRLTITPVLSQNQSNPITEEHKNSGMTTDKDDTSEGFLNVSFL